MMLPRKIERSLSMMIAHLQVSSGLQQHGDDAHCGIRLRIASDCKWVHRQMQRGVALKITTMHICAAGKQLAAAVWVVLSGSAEQGCGTIVLAPWLDFRHALNEKLQVRAEAMLRSTVNWCNPHVGSLVDHLDAQSWLVQQQELLETISRAVHCAQHLGDAVLRSSSQEIRSLLAALPQSIHAPDSQDPDYRVPANLVHSIQARITDPCQALVEGLICGWKPSLLVHRIASKEGLRQTQDEVFPVAGVFGILDMARFGQEAIKDDHQQVVNGKLVAFGLFDASIGSANLVVQGAASETSIKDRALRASCVHGEAVEEAIHGQLLLICQHERHLQVGAQEVGRLLEPAPASSPPGSEIATLLQLCVHRTRSAYPEVVAALHVAGNRVDGLVEGLILGLLGYRVVIQPNTATCHLCD
mmetsp:Transcript_74342/g.177123  ORF Transcript_74342/g.177123 Transcript_74342/m.177123 type:complete len:415 (+) Transcript_74342:266-1510(+)